MIAGGTRYIVYRSRTDEFQLWGIGDMHLGNKNCALAKVRRDVQEITDNPNAIAIGLGDYGDYIGFQDKRFDPEAVSPDMPVGKLGQIGMYLMQQVRDVLWPAREHFIGLLYGNHEAKYQVHMQQQQLHGWLCTELGVPTLGYCCFVDLVFVRISRAKTVGLLPAGERVPKTNDDKRFRVGIFCHHGAGFAQTPGGKLNVLLRLGTQVARLSDIVLMGHIHEKLEMENPGIAPNAGCTKIVEVKQLLASCGGYLRTYAEGAAGYGEQKAYRPTPLGSRIISIRPDKRTFEIAR